MVRIAGLLPLTLLLWTALAKSAAFCDLPSEIGIVDVDADSGDATVTWLESEPSCGRTHYNVAWAGGGGRVQHEVPVTKTSKTWLARRVKGAVYTVSVQACTSRTAASSKCGPWVSRKFVSCGTKGVPCGHPRLNAPQPMVITSGADLCLDVHAPDQAQNGAKVQVWACNGSPQQTWVIDEKAGAIISLAGKCLDVQAARVGTDGIPVHMWDCNRQVQQQWSHMTRVLQTPSGLLNPMALKNAGGKCLDVHAPDQFNNGAKVQIWACNNSQQQRWDITPVL